MVQDRRRKGEEKQTERLEVRLGVTLRDQFLNACKRAGDTPSDVLRAAMSGYVEEVELAERKTLRQELTMKLIHNPLKTAAMALTSLAAFALITAPSSADERLFKALDIDEDGAITTKDLSPDDQIILRVLDNDGSGTITLEEFRLVTTFGRITAEGPVSVMADTVTVSEDNEHATYGAEVQTKIYNQEAGGGFDLRLPENTVWKSDASGLEHEDKSGGPITIEFDTQQANIVTIDLSEEGRVKLTTERVGADAFDQNGVGFVIMDMASTTSDG